MPLDTGGFRMEVGTVENPQPFTRMLTSACPRLPYRRRKGETKTVLHWGQRKLLMSEIEFLTLYSSSGDTVLYAGAAPGSHIPFMAEELFPDLRFVLVDPADFHCENTERVEVRQTYFTSALAREFSGRSDVLFISDIRTANPSRQEEMEVEQFVIQDNLAQMEWVALLRPKKSMLKFRLPYPDRVGGATSYLDGDIFLPVWGPQTTTECRLVPCDSLVQRSYSHTVYEEQLFWFNTVYRESRWVLDAPLDNRGDCRYDAVAEVHILSQYLRRFHGASVATLQQLRAQVTALSADISASLPPGTHTLASRPLNKLLEERTEANPTNQAPRRHGSSQKRCRELQHPPSSVQMEGQGDRPTTATAEEAPTVEGQPAAKKPET